MIWHNRSVIWIALISTHRMRDLRSKYRLFDLGDSFTFRNSSFLNESSASLGTLLWCRTPNWAILKFPATLFTQSLPLNEYNAQPGCLVWFGKEIPFCFFCFFPEWLRSVGWNRSVATYRVSPGWRCGIVLLLCETGCREGANRALWVRTQCLIWLFCVTTTLRGCSAACACMNRKLFENRFNVLDIPALGFVLGYSLYPHR